MTAGCVNDLPAGSNDLPAGANDLSLAISLLHNPKGDGLFTLHVEWTSGYGDEINVAICDRFLRFSRTARCYNLAERR
jgi:hypothetical protein